MASDSLANLSREELVSRVQQAEQLVSAANHSLAYLRMTSSHSFLLRQGLRCCGKACVKLGGMRYFLASTFVPAADFAAVPAVPTRTATKQQPQ